MNSQHIKIVLLLLVSSSTLRGSVGCMDVSYHAKQEKYFQRLARSMGTRSKVHYKLDEYKTDYKTPHYVECTCPCQKNRKVVSNRGKCMKCLHFGDIARSYPLKGEPFKEEQKKSFALFDQDKTR